jgi:hypothetical protein
MVFLHAHLQVVYYNCVKFHKNSISSLVEVALTRYMPPRLFRESISWIISPFKFWTATIFLHAHLQVVYYKCVKFHKNPISGLAGVALTRYMDGWTDRVIPIYPPPNFVCGGYKNYWVPFDHKCKSPIYRYHYVYKLERHPSSSLIFVLGPCCSSY